MTFNLDKYLDEELPVLDAVDLPGPQASGVPTREEIWLWKLEDAVGNIVQERAGCFFGGQSGGRPNGDYDHHWQYAHGRCLKSKEDVRRAPDRILFEAIGLNPSHWGWLQFMVRDQMWFSLLAANWGHPALVFHNHFMGVEGEEEGEDLRRAAAVSDFLLVARSQGFDPRAEVREAVAEFRATGLTVLGREMSEDELRAWMKKDAEWEYFVHRFAEGPPPGASLSPAGEPRYRGDHRKEFAGQILDAAGRRRQFWSADWSCDCAESEAVAG